LYVKSQYIVFLNLTQNWKPLFLADFAIFIGKAVWVFLDFLGSFVACLDVFLIVVVAERLLCTTTTRGLRGVLCFVFWVRFRLQAGCANCHKQFAVAFDEKQAFAAGSLLLSRRNVPIADVVIASFVKTGIAEYVLTDDPHFKALGVNTKWF